MDSITQIKVRNCARSDCTGIGAYCKYINFQGDTFRELKSRYYNINFFINFTDPRNPKIVKVCTHGSLHLVQQIGVITVI